jgi:hypothetical protein
MDVTDRYLYAVQRYLPKNVDDRDDIIAELGEALQSRLDEREVELGRPLDTGETVAVIKQFGHPRVVAGRYGKHQALITADLFPFYLDVLKFVLSLVIAIELLVAVSMALVTGNGEYFLQGLGAAWTSLFTITGGVTVAFALLERLPNDGNPLRTIGLDRWDPRRLPAPQAPGLPEVSRVSSFFEFLANALFLFILLGSQPARHALLLVTGPVSISNGHIGFTGAFTRAWDALHLFAAIALALIAITALVTLVRPDWPRLREAVHLAANSLLIAGCGLALHGGTLFSASPGSDPGMVATANEFAQVFLAGAIIVLGILAALNVRHLMRKNRVVQLRSIVA